MLSYSQIVMEVEFEKQYLEDLYVKGKTDEKRYRFQPSVINGYLKCVKSLLNASKMEDLYSFHSLNYEKLKGNLQGFSSLRINDKYRLLFREIANKETATVELCSLTDITNHYK